MEKIEQLNSQLSQGAQSVCEVIYDEKQKCLLFTKTLNSKDDYQTEVRAYLAINELLKENNNYPFLELLQNNDYICSMTFRYVSTVFSKTIPSKGFTEQFALFFFTQVATGVKLLHSKGMTHNDIKPHNILIDMKENKTMVKLIDYGHSQFIKYSMKSRKPCGTTQYNPYKFNLDLANLKSLKIQQINEYCPYQLDLFQLGMLLLHMFLPRTLNEQNKKYFNNPKLENSFWQTIEKSYSVNQQLLKQNSKQKMNNTGAQGIEPTKLKISSDMKSLIWKLLTGQIKECFEIFDQPIYTQGKGKSILEFFNQSIASQNTIEVEDEQNNQVTITDKEETYTLEYIYKTQKSETSSRTCNSSPNLSIEDLKQDFKATKYKVCEDIPIYKDVISKFKKQQPRQVHLAELMGRSVIIDKQAEELVKILLKEMALQFNQDILKNPKDLFQCKGSLKMIVDLFVEYNEAIMPDIDSEDFDECQQPIVIKVKRPVKMSVEVVSVPNKDDLNQTLRSVLYELIEGDQNDYYQLVNELQEIILRY